jgi:hypothetical protein
MYNGTITANAVTPSVNMKNRIINGAMVIDQRNAGASVTVSANDTAVYIADRWYIAKNSSATISSQQTTVAPTGFSNSLLVNVSSGSAVGSTNYLVCGQAIEGFNFADMAWGTASAATINISFWVRSSLTGTFAVTLANSANNRCFGANYTISVADTWEYKTITVVGDTTGTWVGATNGVGLTMYFSLGAGSSYQGSAGSWQAISNLLNTSTAQNTFLTAANSFYITGVQLEKGSTATSFDYRPYGTESYLCYRYYQAIVCANYLSAGFSSGGAPYSSAIPYLAVTRTSPSITLPAAGQTANTISFTGSNGGYPATTGTNTLYSITTKDFALTGSGYSGLTSGEGVYLYSNGNVTYQISAEL